MEINDYSFIESHFPKIPEECIIKILINFKDRLDKCNARIEKPNIGTFIYLQNITPTLAYQLRKSIEMYT